MSLLVMLFISVMTLCFSLKDDLLVPLLGLLKPFAPPCHSVRLCFVLVWGTVLSSGIPNYAFKVFITLEGPPPFFQVG